MEGFEASMEGLEASIGALEAADGALEAADGALEAADGEPEAAIGAPEAAIGGPGLRSEGREGWIRRGYRMGASGERPASGVAPRGPGALRASGSRRISLRTMDLTIRGWRAVGPGKLESFEARAGVPGPGRVLVAVAGCGICHTDLGYLYDGVPTQHPFPLVLGHEIVGTVVAAGDGAGEWNGRRVLVPAVSPCGRCRWCRAGRPTACRASLMPGNDEDGGFASHVEVPARWLSEIGAGEPPPGAGGLELWELAVVADAVTTPLQAVRRAQVGPGDLAIVVGAGGVGVYAVQIARAAGAAVAAIDVTQERRARAVEYGAALALAATENPKDIKAALRKLCRATGAAPDGWRVLETSGTRAGQELAWSLLTPGGSISVVGYTAAPGTFRLSNLMAYDATAYGNWGCAPALYPEALALVTAGTVRVRGLVRRESLAEAPKIIEAVHRGEIAERVVLVPA